MKHTQVFDKPMDIYTGIEMTRKFIIILNVPLNNL